MIENRPWLNFFCHVILILGVAIIHWFEKRRARALSALQFGSAIGGLFVFAVAASIQAFGWRLTAIGCIDA